MRERYCFERAKAAGRRCRRCEKPVIDDVMSFGGVFKCVCLIVEQIL